MKKYQLTVAQTEFINKVWGQIPFSASQNIADPYEILSAAQKVVDTTKKALLDLKVDVVNGFLFLEDLPTIPVGVLPRKVAFSEEAYQVEGRILERAEVW